MATLETRKRADGSKSYRIQYYEDGIRRRTAYIDNKNEAMQEKADIEKALQLKKSIERANVINPLLSQFGFQPLHQVTLVEFFLIYHQKRLQEVQVNNITSFTLNRQLYSLQLLIDMFPGMMLCQLTRDHLESYLYTRAKIITNNGANKDFSNLKTVLNFAHKWGFVQAKFWEQVNLLRENKKLPEYFTPTQIEEIERYVNPEIYKFAYQLIKFTGMRRSAATRLLWSDFEKDFSFIYLKKNKTKVERFIPIHDKLKPILLNRFERLNPNPDDRVIPVHPDMLTEHFGKAIESAGYKRKGAAVHVLRHSLGAYLTEKGTPLHIIAQILGHRTLDMAKRYSQLSIKKQTETINQLY